jgi:hypothetical protein
MTTRLSIFGWLDVYAQERFGVYKNWLSVLVDRDLGILRSFRDKYCGSVFSLGADSQVNGMVLHDGEVFRILWEKLIIFGSNQQGDQLIALRVLGAFHVDVAVALRLDEARPRESPEQPKQ